jgi:hypothetical protein
MSRIIWKRPDDGISVTHIIDFSGTPEEHALLLKSRGDIPADWQAVEFPSDVNLDREFRNAWSHDVVNGLHVDIVKARDVTKDRLRQERAPLLAELDTAYIRALEINASTAAVVSEKQRLRDLTQSVDGMTSLEEMSQVQATASIPSLEKAGAPAMLARQSNQAVEQLDAAIQALPVSQRPAFELVKQLLKKE